MLCMHVFTPNTQEPTHIYTHAKCVQLVQIDLEIEGKKHSKDPKVENLVAI